VAEDLDDGQLRALAHMYRLDLLLTLADIEAVERELAALQRRGETRTDRYLTWLVRVLRASHALLQGRLEDAESLARDAFDHRYGGHDETATRIFTVQMLLVRIAQGRLEEFVDIVTSSASQYPQNVSWRCALALVHLRLGQTQQVREELEALARAGFTDLPRDESWLTNLWTLSAIVAVLGDAPRAQLLYELLLPYADRCVVSGALMCMGSASHPLGLLATTLSRYEDAERHFEQALKMNTQIRSPFWTAHTQHDYARMVLLRSRVGDRDRALQLLAQALATAEQLGLKALADKVESLKLTAEGAELSLALPRFA
jgi:tetratricopeptide (TPR) repeat protein